MLMKVFVALCCLSSYAMSAQLPAVAAETAGVREIKVQSRARQTDLTATVWYPAEAGGSPITLGESVFFVGTSAMRDASVANGRFPLILLSHGAGLAGTPAALSWIAVPLAQRGFIVAAPTHPGNGGANRSAAETMKLWLRPSDISATLDAISDEAFFGEHIEHDKVGMLGLSMGGGTALAMGGARFDPDKLASYCDTDERNPSLCEWVRLSGVDLHAMDMTKATRDSRDERIRSIMAIDPAPMDVFAPSSFSEIAIPTVIINLGRAEELPLTVRADKAAAAMKHATYSTIADASHYSMFPDCKLGAAEIAQAENVGDPICSDGGGRSRKDIHDELIEAMGQAFDRALKQSH